MRTVTTTLVRPVCRCLQAGVPKVPAQELRDPIQLSWAQVPKVAAQEFRDPIQLSWAGLTRWMPPHDATHWSPQVHGQTAPG